MSAGAAFEVSDLCFAYEGSSRLALDGVSFAVAPGVLYTVIGPNGSGKSTLLKLLLGALQPAQGRVVYAGRPLPGWSRRDLARQIGVVPQGGEIMFPVTVREIVEMGRYPHLGLLGRPGRLDHAAVDEALERCDIVGLADRPLSRLSGGERQRALVARALAQQPATLVLDEPTISLDIRHEMQIFELLAELTRQDSVTVVLVTHHLNLAARYADRMLLLDGGAPAAEGPPNQVLRREAVEQVYGWPVAVGAHPGPGRDAGAPQILPLAGTDPSGEPVDGGAS
ncbi:MAG: ABC transporter ATP-binding protein [Gemmatimonadetes bacterium]|uniref:ABC transporter ATP-binding protein n=1 Tax=Candidatus Kutchimonas denitrificans TaxID=3056748 RepID=A0AAE4Z5M3_9BACT|nr:ABC transporter ATP-binding protein [Gemmatimonadota bacterium]NIR74003.1 ABC transporter ATP-binding protein [Candidatus Kutchimonas denitrificans]NIS02992.1 ABC transporter ATP-binding protein [Gemmatimonadota bacterium]NIT68709.1 ABC transporter ATP-binding protein [Gemmatimonadota bacterium]NIU53290.1 ATP-binding cassette domain-containing protein [Gemmatimonadota bacterium]